MKPTTPKKVTKTTPKKVKNEIDSYGYFTWDYTQIPTSRPFFSLPTKKEMTAISVLVIVWVLLLAYLR